MYKHQKGGFYNLESLNSSRGKNRILPFVKGNGRGMQRADLSKESERGRRDS